MPAKDMALYMRNRRAKRRSQLVSMLGGRCAECGFTLDLQIDHKDGSTKSFNLSGWHLDKPMTELVAELNKCQLLCYVHHREKTIKAGETGGGRRRTAMV